jgi:hypothetical protein
MSALTSTLRTGRRASHGVDSMGIEMLEDDVAIPISAPIIVYRNRTIHAS